MLKPQDLDAILTWLLNLEDRGLTARIVSLGDNAGQTRLGITSRDAALMPPNFFDPALPPADAIAMARTFYTHSFWERFAINKKCGDSLPLCAAYLSCAVNCGPGTAFECLTNAQKQPGDAALIDKFTYLWCEHYYDITEVNPELGKFLHGWIARAKAIYPALPA